MRSIFFLFIIGFFITNCTPPMEFDTILKGGTIYDGTGTESKIMDIGINADTIAAIGNLKGAKSNELIDVSGLAVAPGFINMLSWAVVSLIEDGRSMGDIYQGVTLEVFGEGTSMGPIPEERKKIMESQQGDIKFSIDWNSLDEYLEYLVERGVSPNVASFLGATTLRINTVGYEDREATEEELEEMRMMTRIAMEEGALGIGSSLIYAPAFYSTTEELIEICKVAAKYDGMYISHIRNESNSILKSIDELIRISKEAGIRSEIYHLKQAGKSNWNKLDKVVAKIDSARDAGIQVTTDMYTYIAGSTGLDAAMPPWVQEGGYKAWANRLKDPVIRKKVLNEMRTPTNEWENLLLLAGDPKNVLLVGFKNDDLKNLTGKSLAEVAKLRNKTPEETAIELVIEDGSRVGTVYFLMSEENVKKQIQLPYMSFGSDAASMAPEGVFLKSSTHPRAYGNFARLLGKYVREERVIPLEAAIYKLTGLPASNLKLENRGLLKEGFFADLAIFDPEKIQDKATFENPHQLAEGMVHVLVNGEFVLKDSEHTGAKPGKVVRGPGYNK